jgi:transcription-repair coupling factor (superfamily II helicase)
MSSLSALRSHVAALPGTQRLQEALSVPGAEVAATAPPGARSALIAALAAAASDRAATTPVLAVTATGREAEDLQAALEASLGSGRVGLFPSWETLPHERLSPRSDTVGQRLSVLRRLAHPDAGDASHGHLAVVVAPVRAVLQPIAKGLGDLRPVALQAGDERPLEQVVEDLAAAAYARTDLVERRGEFAVRGGILDVFPPTEEHPLRLEFWGDTVEEIRWFKVADQRSLEVAEHGLWAPPCRELLLTDTVRERAAALADRLPGAVDLLEKLAHGIAVEGMESLSPALVDGMETLLDVLPQGSLLVTCDPERVRTRAHDLTSTSQEFLEAGWANAASGNVVPIDLQSVLGTASFRTLAELRAQARDLGVRWLDLTPFAGDEDGDVLDLGLEVSPTFRGDTDAAVTHLRALVADNWSVLVATEGPGLAKRVAEVFAEHDVPSRLVSAGGDAGSGGAHPASGVVTVTTGAAGPGFLVPAQRLAVITESDLTGSAGGSGTSTKDMRRMPSRRRNQVDPLALQPGDFVVHEQHGVGKFVEMVQRTVATATREYLVLEYAPSKRGQPGDRLYVPTDQLDQVTRYVGGEQPTLSKMGGSDWQQTKSRAKRYVKQIAAELIRLYSARMATTGHAFSPDTPWQRELEDAFAHIETPDQLSTIDEVKADMERSVPMDRLVCGDVGYGKTEIAVRAAFKAVQDGKQVAILCPTTLLVQQHANTFAERYAGFPVVVKALSRFQTDKEAKAVLAGLADGSVDLVIGTHRLLSKEVQFKDLGLVVIDEEQRFGVEHKEAAQEAAHNGRRARDVGHADPAHAGDGRHRHPGDVDARDAARGAPPRPHLRRGVRRQDR